MENKIGVRPIWVQKKRFRAISLAKAICGSNFIEEAEEIACGIKKRFKQAPPRHPERLDLPRDIFLGGLTTAYTLAASTALGWRSEWVVDRKYNYRNSEGSNCLVSLDDAYFICPANLIHSDYHFDTDTCVNFYLKAKNRMLPPSAPGKLLYLKDSFFFEKSKIGMRECCPIPTEPTPPEALALIDKILGNNSGPKFRKFPENKQADLLQAAQAALTMLKLPVDPSMLKPEEVVQAMDQEVQEFLLLGESEIPDIFLATLSAQFGYCLVWAYGAEWKLAPKDEGDMLYVIGKGEDGWAQPSDLVRTALQGTKRSSLSSSFKSFQRP
jgi:hypothetical protein